MRHRACFFLITCVVLASRDPHRRCSPTCTKPRAEPYDSSEDVKLVDLDRDGDLDAIWSEYAVHINDGTGIFQAADPTRLPAAWGLPTLEVEDLDGDGDLDLFFGIGSEPPVLEHRASVIRRRHRHGPAARSDWVISSVSGDLDGDGDLDLIYGCYLRLPDVPNDGSGRFADTTSANLRPTRAGPTM